MKRILIIFVLICANLAFSQTENVGIGTATPDNSAILDLNASNKGLLIPRMIETQKNSISSPATGLIVYQTDANAGFYYYNGTIWVAIPFNTEPISLADSLNTLNKAYNQGGAGAGRVITADAGAVEVTGNVDANTVLELTNDGDGGVLLIDNNGDGRGIDIQTGGSSDGLFINNLGTGFGVRIDDEAGDTSPFIIDGDGNVGIGILAPDEKLEVDGAVLRKGFAMVAKASAQAITDGNEYEISFQTNVRMDSDFYSFNGSDEITISPAGWYRISYNVNIENNSANHSTQKFAVFDDGGELSGSSSYAYVRDNAGGQYASGSSSFIASIGANSVITLRVQRQAGDNYSIIAGTQITIERID